MSLDSNVWPHVCSFWRPAEGGDSILVDILTLLEGLLKLFVFGLYNFAVKGDSGNYVGLLTFGFLGVISHL